MFENTPVESVLADVRASDFSSEPVLLAGHHRIDAIVALDRSIRAAQAEQAGQIAALHAERSTVMRIGEGDPTLSIIGEVSMARNIGPTAASTQVGLALGLSRLPKVFDLLRTGVISEATARAVVTETAALHLDDLPIADAELAERIPGLTTVQARHAAARIVIGIDAEAAYERAQRNRADQRVSLFPEVDGVATLHVRGPAEQLLAAFKSLDSWATGLRSTGDPRTRGQIMCQTLIERVTGQAHADDINVEVNLVLDAETLLAGGDTPVELEGYGPISPDVADEIIARAPNASIRPLLVDPVDGSLVVREPRRRRFDAPTKAHIRARDQRCRQPGCDCTIRDDDHILEYQHGGLSIKHNGQGLCERSHTIRHQPGWTITGHGQATTWRTPTGHQYHSTPPPALPGRTPGHLRQKADDQHSAHCSRTRLNPRRYGGGMGASQWVTKIERLLEVAHLRRSPSTPMSFRIEPYGGHGGPDGTIVRGRVLDNAEPSRAAEGEGVGAAVRRSVQNFLTRELPGVPLRVEVGGATVNAVSDDDGYFLVRVPTSAPLRSPWARGTVSLGGEYRGLTAAHTAAVDVRVPGPAARLGIISDIDDTVIKTGVQRAGQMVLQTMAGSELTREAFPGAAALYRDLAAEVNPVFYVSSSPWNLHAFLSAFLAHHDFPRGPVLLRDLLGTAAGREQKHGRIREILDLHPDLPFVLIGDSGEKDPEIYADIVRSHPGRILAVYIREVRLDPGDGTVEQVAQGWAPDVPFVLAADSQAVRRHAETLGIV